MCSLTNRDHDKFLAILMDCLHYLAAQNDPSKVTWEIFFLNLILSEKCLFWQLYVGGEGRGVVQRPCVYDVQKREKISSMVSFKV